jgi:hypothetical protein
MHAETKGGARGQLATMRSAYAGGVLHVRHRSQSVGDADWQKMLDDMDQLVRPGQTLRILVKTDNAGPNAAQRNRFHQFVTSKKIQARVAVLSTSVLVRGIVTAFSWMRMIEIASFGETDYAGALAFLGATQVTPASAESTIKEIEQGVG